MATSLAQSGILMRQTQTVLLSHAYIRPFTPPRHPVEVTLCLNTHQSIFTKSCFPLLPLDKNESDKSSSFPPSLLYPNCPEEKGTLVNHSMIEREVIFFPRIIKVKARVRHSSINFEQWLNLAVFLKIVANTTTPPLFADMIHAEVNILIKTLLGLETQRTDQAGPVKRLMKIDESVDSKKERI